MRTSSGARLIRKEYGADCMTKITPAQCRKIYVLAKERGIDNDTLHSHIYNLTNRESIKGLSISEAVKVIDSLEGIDTKRMTYKQKEFIFKLCRRLKWVNESGEANIDTLSGFIKNQTGVPNINWLTKKQASKIIEAMKAIAEKDRESNG